MNVEHPLGSESSSSWQELAFLAFQNPLSPGECPSCGAHAVSAAWNLVDLRSRATSVDLHCNGCGSKKSLEIVLPEGSLGFFPFDRLNDLERAISKEVDEVTSRIRAFSRTIPSLAFVANPIWHKAKWSATTFRCHPKSEAPPVMGLVFEDRTWGLRVFEEWMKDHGNDDAANDLRVSVIEGSPHGQRFGYSVHIAPNPETILARATVEGLVFDLGRYTTLGRANRMYPDMSNHSMLSNFKMEYERHREFMLAPAVPRSDGQLWFEHEYGIVKRAIHFRRLADITPDDVDAVALALPSFITPRVPCET